MNSKTKSLLIHPIVRQIIDRDCHVSLSNRAVIRHVISNLRDGRQTYFAMPREDRRSMLRHKSRGNSNSTDQARLMKHSKPYKMRISRFTNGESIGPWGLRSTAVVYPLPNGKLAS